MQFTKMHGLGNDYVVLDGRGMALDKGQRSDLAKRLCDRHFGIGADGLLILKVGKQAQFEMEMYNPDGSRGESCGNGLRCAGKYLWDKEWTKEDSFQVETMGVVKSLERLKCMRTVYANESFWRVGMGTAKMGESRKLKLGDGCGKTGMDDVMAYRVSMGNPHAVIFPEAGEPGEWRVGTLGPAVENAKAFPNRTNVEFVRVRSRNEIVMRVWERGVGETLACGTGACAAAAICMQKDLTDEEITVKLLGGEMIVSKDGLTGGFFLAGPAVTVFEGEIRE